MTSESEFRRLSSSWRLRTRSNFSQRASGPDDVVTGPLVVDLRLLDQGVDDCTREARADATERRCGGRDGVKEEMYELSGSVYSETVLSEVGTRLFLVDGIKKRDGVRGLDGEL